MYIIRNLLRCFSSEIFGVAECEIIHLVNYEISHFVRCEMKFAFSHLRSKYFTAKLFHLAEPNFTRRRRISLKNAHLRCRCAFFWRRHPDLNWRITVLQTVALPLGYVAGQETLPLWGAFSIWSGLRGSNPPPPPWQGGALPNELNPHIVCTAWRRYTPSSYAIAYEMVPRVGIEPTTRRFSVYCSTN